MELIMARESASINFDTVIIDQKGKAMEKCIADLVQLVEL